MAKAPRFSWYKHDAQDFLIGVQGMGPDMIGAYIVILDLIYARGGELHRDDRHLAGVLGCSIRLAKSLTDRLIEAGKISISDGVLINFRAKNELKQQREVSERRAKAQRDRREKEAVSNENNDIATYTYLNEASLEEKRREDKEISTDVLTKKDRKPDRKGCRLPSDFKPDQDWSKSTGLPREILVEEFQKFQDYWNGKTGKDATKLDWQATWRNWIRNSRAFQSMKPGPKNKKTIGESFVDLAVDMGILGNGKTDCAGPGLFSEGDAARNGPVLDVAVSPSEPGDDAADDFTRRLLHRP